MATEVITQTWCDVCLTQHGKRTKAAATHVLTLDSRTKHLDLCEGCDGEVTGPIVEILSTFGEATPSSGRRRARGDGPPSARPADCPLCGATLSNAAAVRSHLRSGKHGLSDAEVAQVTARRT